MKDRREFLKNTGLAAVGTIGLAKSAKALFQEETADTGKTKI